MTAYVALLRAVNVGGRQAARWPTSSGSPRSSGSRIAADLHRQRQSAVRQRQEPRRRRSASSKQALEEHMGKPVGGHGPNGRRDGGRWPRPIRSPTSRAIASSRSSSTRRRRRMRSSRRRMSPTSGWRSASARFMSHYPSGQGRSKLQHSGGGHRHGAQHEHASPSSPSWQRRWNEQANAGSARVRRRAAGRRVRRPARRPGAADGHPVPDGDGRVRPGARASRGSWSSSATTASSPTSSARNSAAPTARRDVRRDEAGSAADRGALRRRLLAMRRARPRARRKSKASSIVVAGYCFGGLCALDVARSGADIAGAVELPRPARPARTCRRRRSRPRSSPSTAGTTRWRRRTRSSRSARS